MRPWGTQLRRPDRQTGPRMRVSACPIAVGRISGDPLLTRGTSNLRPGTRAMRRSSRRWEPTPGAKHRRRRACVLCKGIGAAQSQAFRTRRGLDRSPATGREADGQQRRLDRGEEGPHRTSPTRHRNGRGIASVPRICAGCVAGAADHRQSTPAPHCGRVGQGNHRATSDEALRRLRSLIRRARVTPVTCVT